MIDRYLVPYLLEDSALVALLPTTNVENPDFDDEEEESELNPLTIPVANVFRRIARQNATRPFVTVVPPHDHDDGTVCTGVMATKITNFRIIIAGDVAISDLDPIRDRITAILRSLRLKRIPEDVTAPQLWVQCVIIDDIVFQEVRAVDGNEQQLPGWVFYLKAGYVET